MAAIRKRKNGKFEVQIRRKGLASISRTFHKRKDAEAWARHPETIADKLFILCASSAYLRAFYPLLWVLLSLCNDFQNEGISRWI